MIFFSQKFTLAVCRKLELPASQLFNPRRRCSSVWIAGGVEPPTVFSVPLTHCQIMYRGVS